MGHQRLGDIPKTQKWAKVVAKVTGGGQGMQGGSVSPETIREIAAETLDAAETGLVRSIDDPGLRFTFYLLTQIVLAARDANWQGALAGLGIHISDESSLYDLTSELQIAVDDHLSQGGSGTGPILTGGSGTRREPRKRDGSDIAKSGEFFACPYCQ